MIASRYFIRVFSSGIDKWIADKPELESLVKVFDLAKPDQSVYEVADGEEECLAAAAHMLASRKSPAPASFLRIYRATLSQFGIAVDADQFGTTGVPLWDRRHRNLLANRDQLLELIRYTVERLSRGHDLVRRVEKKFVVRAVNSICSYPPRHCPEHVKHIAQWCQNDAKDKPACPPLFLQQIEKEMLEVEFEDEAIRPAAERLGSGDALRDWYGSLRELRRCYADHYLPQIARRFGLSRSEPTHDDPAVPRPGGVAGSEGRLFA